MSDLRVLNSAERPISGQAVRHLYDFESWWPERSPDEIEAVIAAHPAVGAWRDDHLVGFARAITDGRFRAYAEDVIVDPDERRHGVAHALLDRLAHLLQPVPLLTLFSGPRLVTLYETAGFRATNQVVLHRRLASDVMQA